MISLLCDFWKAHNTYHALFKLVYSCQKELAQKGIDSTPHDLLIAKNSRKYALHITLGMT